MRPWRQFKFMPLKGQPLELKVWLTLSWYHLRRGWRLATHDHRICLFWGPLWLALAHTCGHQSTCEWCANWSRTGDSWEFDENWYDRNREAETVTA